MHSTENEKVDKSRRVSGTTQTYTVHPRKVKRSSEQKRSSIIISTAGALVIGAVAVASLSMTLPPAASAFDGAGHSIITRETTGLNVSASTPFEGYVSFSDWQDRHEDEIANLNMLGERAKQLVNANTAYISDESRAEIEIALGEMAFAIPQNGEDSIDEYTIANLNAAYKKLDDAVAKADNQIDAAKAEEKARLEREAKLASITSGIDTTDWSDDKIAFVSEWGPRIDDYLDGRPACGYGEHFAAAAYDYDVDPRIGAAIAVIESGAGQACFLENNMWGWGSSSWGSMEEAIEGWTAAFHRGYGYDMDAADCAAYCPPNPGYYSKLRDQMEQI